VAKDWVDTLASYCSYVALWCCPIYVYYLFIPAGIYVTGGTMMDHTEFRRSWLAFNGSMWLLAFLLYNIGDICKQLRALRALVGHGEASAYDVFVTHDFGMDEQGRSNHERATMVNEALRAAGLTTWFEADQPRASMAGDEGTHRQMMERIDRSSLVLVFITNNYIRTVAGQEASDAQNCKAEFEYATDQKGVGKMLPVVMESGCRDQRLWHGAMGMRLGGKLYQDLSEDGQDFEAGTRVLVERIRSELSIASNRAGDGGT